MIVFATGAIAGCGPHSTLRDPLLGMWTWGGPSTGVCEFFENGKWTNGCYVAGGGEGNWERLGDDRYYIEHFGGGCDVHTTFSADEQSVAMTWRCGSTSTAQANLTRFQ